jgi:hypothetical protein
MLELFDEMLLIMNLSDAWLDEDVLPISDEFKDVSELFVFKWL